jgi:hypothetical protein
LVGKTKKPTSMTDEDWEDLDARALNTIHLFLKMKCCLTSLKRRQQKFVEQTGESVYEKFLDEHNLLEEVVVQLADERRYKIVDHLNVFNTLICQLSSMDVTYKMRTRKLHYCVCFLSLGII